MNHTYMRKISGEFFLEKHLTQGTLSCLPPHPWGKFSTLLNPFYNPPGWPGVLPLGQADDMCITICFCISNYGDSQGSMTLAGFSLLVFHIFPKLISKSIVTTLDMLLIIGLIPVELTSSNSLQFSRSRKLEFPAL